MQQSLVQRAVSRLRRRRGLSHAAEALGPCRRRSRRFLPGRRRQASAVYSIDVSGHGISLRPAHRPARRLTCPPRRARAQHRPGASDSRRKLRRTARRTKTVATLLNMLMLEEIEIGSSTFTIDARGMSTSRPVRGATSRNAGHPQPRSMVQRRSGPARVYARRKRLARSGSSKMRDYAQWRDPQLAPGDRLLVLL